MCSTCFGHLYAHHQELETIIALLSHTMCNALVCGGRLLGAEQQARRLGWGKQCDNFPHPRRMAKPPAPDRPLLQGYKPVQHVAVLNTAGNFNTMVIIVILWDHRRICGLSLTETSLCGAYPVHCVELSIDLAMNRLYIFIWFCRIYACRLQNFAIQSYIYGSVKAIYAISKAGSTFEIRQFFGKPN